MYRLTLPEREEYQRKFTHIAPEVISGEYRQSTFSDMFSVGGVFYRIIDSNVLQSKEIDNSLSTLAKQCRMPQYTSRPLAKHVLLQLKNIID